MCGFVGIVSDRPVAGPLLLALQAIQHRGQDAAGLGTWDDRRVHLTKGTGMIPEAVPVARLPELLGNAGIGHVRYPTAGGQSTAADAQPFSTRGPGMVLAHNGNVTNTAELDLWLRERGLTVQSECDAEPILLVLAWALSQRRPSGHTADDVAAAVREVHARVRGAYSVVAVLEVDGKPTLIAFRDVNGIRPGCYGRNERGDWMVASESVAMDVLGFDKKGDLSIGDVLLLRAGETPRCLPVAEGASHPCVFERIYFARPDSLLEDGRVNRTRWLMGRQLAREWRTKGLTADLIVAVPDTSRPAAMAMADELGLKHREGFIKNRYSGRTFIMPDQATRDMALRLKLNPIREMFEGKRVLLVDDSIVRGTTMRRLVRMVRALGPTALHLAIFSPPVTHPCFYGIDMPSTDELLAARFSPDELGEYLGVDSLTYLSVEGMRAVAGKSICDACFTGRYVVPVSEEERLHIERARRPG
jgi:amidophosphoribosyltransferase